LLKQPGYRQPKDQDLKDAKQLLDAAGVKDLAVTVASSNWSKPSVQTPTEALVDQLSKIGVKVTPDIQDQPTWNRVRTGGDFALLSDSQGGTGDPDTLLRQGFYTQAGGNGGRNYGK